MIRVPSKIWEEEKKKIAVINSKTCPRRPCGLASPQTRERGRDLALQTGPSTSGSDQGSIESFHSVARRRLVSSGPSLAMWLDHLAALRCRGFTVWWLEFQSFGFRGLSDFNTALRRRFNIFSTQPARLSDSVSRVWSNIFGV
jgi:hypothetical protein